MTFADLREKITNELVLTNFLFLDENSCAVSISCESSLIVSIGKYPDPTRININLQ